MTSQRLLAAACLAAAIALPVAATEQPPAPGFNEQTFKGLAWRSIGPAFMSGRIADIAIDPRNRHVWYVAVGSGGVWKTTNAGTSFTPLFDDQPVYSIGAIAIDPNDPDTIWVGTGENVGGRHVGWGNGVYRSRDGGASWEHMGLPRSEHIGMIRIDPRDSQVIYVAAQGPLWSAGGDRGLYKSTDGGRSWQRILSAGPYTGVSEVHLDPRNPDVLYAVTWQRLRNVAAYMGGGPESGIHKSEDGGRTWRQLKAGLPEGPLGKIGMAISPQNPDVLYATIELQRRKGGFWRSTDGGERWEKRSDFAAGGTGPHYYNEIFASPHREGRVYHMDVHLHVSDDGGKQFRRMDADAKHVDHHAMAFVADDPRYLLVGTDGGLYESFDEGGTWRFVANLPVTQFYKVAVDYDEPFYHVYGGTQDNNTQGGPSRTDNVHGIANADWFVTLGGDGHQPAVDPTNPDIVYSQWQQGNLTRHDRRTGEVVYIQPQPGPGEVRERFNWDAPILISAHDPARLYFGSQRLWRSDDRGDSWRPISGDLSRALDRLRLPIMGRLWSWDSPWDLYAMSEFGTISAIAESPLVDGLLYVGTDDGLIHVSEDGGASWRRAAALPRVRDDFYVNDIKADLHDPDTVYVVVDRHKHGDFTPYLLRSTDRGRSWRSIRGNLPDDHIVWRIVQDHVRPGLLFAGTEFGVFFTVDGGRRWTKLAGGVPTIPFRDLVIQRRENDLVGGTFGRGIYVLDDYSPLREVSERLLREQATLFPVPDADWYVPRRTLGCEREGCKASQGDAYFLGQNPPFGAVFTYYLPEKLMSAAERRREAEKPLEAEGKDTPFPGWDTVLAEAREDAPAIVLTVRDAAGRIVRHVTGPTEAGFHRVAWDLRYPDVEPWIPPEQRGPRWSEPAGVLVAPGEYSVQLGKLIDGRLEPLGEARPFTVRAIRPEPAIPGAPQGERVLFLREADALRRATLGAIRAIDELGAHIAAVKESLREANAPPALYERTQRLWQQALALRDRLTQNSDEVLMHRQSPLTVLERIEVARMGPRWNAHGPTRTQRESLAIARTLYGETVAAVDRLLEHDWAALRRELDAAGLRWTPGRGVPVPDAAMR